MKKKTIVGLIAMVGIASVVIFAGCIEVDSSVFTPTPTPHVVSPASSFEIEYPITAYFVIRGGHFQITFYEDGSALSKEKHGEFDMAWRIKEKTTSRYRLKIGTADSDPDVIILSNHDAILDLGDDNIRGYWKKGESTAFEIEYPVTVYFKIPAPIQITLYEDGSSLCKSADDKAYYDEWVIEIDTISKIKYRLRGDDDCFVLFSNHDAVLDPGSGNILGYWR
ncbi:MAG: hypothetical protein EMLJLAPB_00025 [Candidatus Argoarchaeum ethanivorans]|uniref:Uncharacterized protein n=1 Tax=Candidatus Argoarchaeum ethanivorans TaxID=2608793 RepID=A0A811T184_9EURY|nr:MAG: hypothetical protein EMLJLAPB_00025 [Candidatus Argoarchaeum ethanivorans]